MKVKIAYILSTLMRCGPTNQLYNLIKYLDRSIYKPVIITLSPEPEDSLWSQFESILPELYTLNLSRAKGVFSVGSKLKKILAGIGGDIVHSSGMRADILSARYLGRYKRITTLRNCPFYDYLMTYGKVRGRFMAVCHLKAVRKIENRVSVSYSASRMLSERSGLTMEVIQNAVNTHLFQPVANNARKEELRNRFGMPLDKTIFVSTGFLSKLKDPLTIIKAFQSKKIKEYYMFFLGDGSLRKSCEKEARKNSHIKFCGRVLNVAEYLQASDFFISAAQTEGLPNTIMEAMACGLPCVLSDIEPHREIFEYSNMSGKLFKTKDINSLANKINEIIEDNYKDMSRCALNVITNHLSAEIMSKKYQQLYEKIFEDN